MTDIFFKDPELPYAVCRCSTSERHYKPHLHRTFSVGAVVRGEADYMVDGNLLKLRPGNLALINPEILHSCNPPKCHERSYYMLFLDVEWCHKLQQSLWRRNTFCPVSTELLEDESVYGLFVSAVESFKDHGDLMEKEQLLVELAEAIFLKACEPAPVKRAPSLHMEELKRQLGSKLDSDISLSRIAGKMKANPYTLLRQFKAATGITPHAYRLNCRVELARKLLQEGRDLSQVALECGFFDQSHFHRYFKAVTAVTPRAYQINFLQ